VCGKGTKFVLSLLPPAAGWAIEHAVGSRIRGPILLNSRGARMDRRATTCWTMSSRRPRPFGDSDHTARLDQILRQGYIVDWNNIDDLRV
jgi:hypothetical protein